MEKNLFCTGAMLTHPAPDVAHRPPWPADLMTI